MADLIAYLDGAHVYIGSSNAGKVPDGLFRDLVATPFNGQYDPEFPRQLTFTRVAGTEAVTWLRKHGHTVETIRGPRQLVAPPKSVRRWTLPACKVCGQPFHEAALRRWPEGQTCPNVETTRHPVTGVRIPKFEPHTLTLEWGDETKESAPDETHPDDEHATSLVR